MDSRCCKILLLFYQFLWTVGAPEQDFHHIFQQCCLLPRSLEGLVNQNIKIYIGLCELFLIILNVSVNLKNRMCNCIHNLADKIFNQIENPLGMLQCGVATLIIHTWWVPCVPLICLECGAGRPNFQCIDEILSLFLCKKDYFS